MPYKSKAVFNKESESLFTTMIGKTLKQFKT